MSPKPGSALAWQAPGLPMDRRLENWPLPGGRWLVSQETFKLVGEAFWKHRLGGGS